MSRSQVGTEPRPRALGGGQGTVLGRGWVGGWPFAGSLGHGSLLVPQGKAVALTSAPALSWRPRGTGHGRSGRPRAGASTPTGQRRGVVLTSR